MDEPQDKMMDQEDKGAENMDMMAAMMAMDS